MKDIRAHTNEYQVLIEMLKNDGTPRAAVTKTVLADTSGQAADEAVKDTVRRAKALNARNLQHEPLPDTPGGFRVRSVKQSPSQLN